MQRYIILYISVILIASSCVTSGCFASDRSDPVNDHLETVNDPGKKQTPPYVTEADLPADAETMTDIFDIKNPEKIGFDQRIIKYVIYAVIILLVVCVLFFLFDYFMKKRKKKNTEEVCVLPPEVRAYSQLDELDASGDMEARLYYFRLTGIIRGYIGHRFGIDALEMTTEEFIPRINDIVLDKKLNIELKELLKTSDPVKFAGVPAQKEKMDNDFEFAKSFVKNTTPEPDELNKPQLKGND